LRGFVEKFRIGFADIKAAERSGGWRGS